MIRRLKIENFQSHKLTEVEFVDGLNVIVGQSDCGKTAIIRALDWVCNNRPSGDDFRSDWGGDTRVEIELDDGVTILREKRGKSVNLYSIMRGNQTEQFKSFRSEVPADIAEAIAMDPVNWQRQLDSPFLLSDTPGEVASKLNEAVDLDIIDLALSRMIAKVRQNTQDLRSQKAALEEHKDDLSAFDYLPKMEKKLKAIELIEKAADKVDERSFELENLMAKAKASKAVLEKAAVILPAEERLQRIRRLADRKKETQSRKDRLMDILGTAESASFRMRKGKTLMEAHRPCTAVERLWQKRQEMTMDSIELRAISDVAQEKLDLMRFHEAEIKKAKAELKEARKNLTRICPTCGQEIVDE